MLVPCDRNTSCRPLQIVEILQGSIECKEDDGFCEDDSLRCAVWSRSVFYQVSAYPVADPGFTRDGGPKPTGGRGATYDFAKFPQKLHEIEDPPNQ